MNSTEHAGFAEAWERSRPYMVTALEESGGEYTVDDVLSEVQQDHAIFYPAKLGAIVFKVIRYPRKRMLRIWLAGGDMESCLDTMLEASDYYAEKHECDGIEVVGRRGWEKVLKPHGFSHKRVMLIKEL